MVIEHVAKLQKKYRWINVKIPTFPKLPFYGFRNHRLTHHMYCNVSFMFYIPRPIDITRIGLHRKLIIVWVFCGGGGAVVDDWMQSHFSGVYVERANAEQCVYNRLDAMITLHYMLWLHCNSAGLFPYESSDKLLFRIQWDGQSHSIDFQSTRHQLTANIRVNTVWSLDASRFVSDRISFRWTHSNKDFST